MLRRYYGKISKLPIDEFVGHDGELVVDDQSGKVYVMDGVTYGGIELVGSAATLPMLSTPPNAPSNGELWYDIDSGKIFVYLVDAWVDTSSSTVPVATLAPAHANSTGIKGQIAYDSSHVYVCVANNTWKRANLTSW